MTRKRQDTLDILGAYTCLSSYWDREQSDWLEAHPEFQDAVMKALESRVNLVEFPTAWQRLEATYRVFDELMQRDRWGGIAELVRSVMDLPDEV